MNLPNPAAASTAVGELRIADCGLRIFRTAPSRFLRRSGGDSCRPKTQNPEPKTEHLNSEPRTPNSEPRAYTRAQPRMPVVTRMRVLSELIGIMIAATSGFMWPATAKPTAARL